MIVFMLIVDDESHEITNGPLFIPRSTTAIDMPQCPINTLHNFAESTHNISPDEYLLQLWPCLRFDITQLKLER
jgi:hypothetical protein